MKKFFLAGVFFLAYAVTFAQGWRKNEMEAKVYFDNPQQAEIFYKLNIDAEAAAPGGAAVYAYMVPAELEALQQTGLKYEITINDLNAHYSGFWSSKVPSGYMTYEQIVALADSLATNFPSICKKYIFGTSLGGRELGALKISDNVENEEFEPGILFDGGIHGDEIMGPEVVIRYARYLCLDYGTDPVYTDLVNNHEIWLYYMVNPDGRVNMTRYNNNNIDCNRDAGYMWNAEGSSTGAFSQVESKALRNCMLQVNPVIYTNYHGGTEIISYPWSYRGSACADIQHIDQIASVYSSYSGYSNLPYGQGYNIMYAINGSNKDFEYGSMGNVGWSIEITTDKQPPSSQISSFYNKNETAITEVIRRCGFGAEGLITDSLTGEPVAANVWVSNYYPVQTRSTVGDYHKYLLPGTYTIKVTANGYKTRVIPGITVPAEGSVVTNILMQRDTSRYATQVLSSRIPLSSFSGFTNSAFTPGTTSKPDNIPYSLWRNGWIVLDMGDTIFNAPGKDFKVYEGDADPEGFNCYAGTTKDGPWTLIESGVGTTEFDLGTAIGGAVNKARYIKISDDGDGPTTGNNLGFELDAVEMITKPLIASFAASDKTPCIGSNVSFTDYSWGDAVSWHWEFPGGTPSVSTDQNPVVVYNAPGNYDVILKVTNSFCSNTKIKTGYISVHSMPAVSLGNDTTVHPSETVPLDAGNPGSTYLWSTGETTQTIIADSTGTGVATKAVWVNVTDPYGCAATDTILVTFSWPAGIFSHENSDISIYPNPANEFFFIDQSGKEKMEISIISPEGKIIQKTSSESSHLKINTFNFEKGIYLIRISTKKGTETGKIIIL